MTLPDTMPRAVLRVNANPVHVRSISLALELSLIGGPQSTPVMTAPRSPLLQDRLYRLAWWAASYVRWRLALSEPARLALRRNLVAAVCDQCCKELCGDGGEEDTVASVASGNDESWA